MIETRTLVQSFFVLLSYLREDIVDRRFYKFFGTYLGFLSGQICRLLNSFAAYECCGHLTATKLLHSLTSSAEINMVVETIAQRTDRLA